MPAGLRVPGDIDGQIFADAAEIRLIHINRDLYAIQLADQADDRSGLKIRSYFEIELIKRAGDGSNDGGERKPMARQRKSGFSVTQLGLRHIAVAGSN